MRALRSEDCAENMGGQWMGASAFSAPASASFKCCWQNGLVESFNGKLRDELLHREWFRTLAEVRGLIEAWREFYNERRPHSALRYRTPAEFAAMHRRQRMRNQPSPGIG